MANAGQREGAAGDSSAVRRCADCGADVALDLRYCPSCGRFVPGAVRPLAGIATGAGGVLLPPLVLLALAGYIWIPVVGILAEAVLWGYVFLTGDWRVSGRRILIGTGIGLVLLAIVAVVMRLCGVGA